MISQIRIYIIPFAYHKLTSRLIGIILDYDEMMEPSQVHDKLHNRRRHTGRKTDK